MQEIAPAAVQQALAALHQQQHQTVDNRMQHLVTLAQAICQAMQPFVLPLPLQALLLVADANIGAEEGALVQEEAEKMMETTNAPHL